MSGACPERSRRLGNASSESLIRISLRDPRPGFVSLSLSPCDTIKNDHPAAVSYVSPAAPSNLAIAAVHVAKNLDIPGGFDALKAKMTGSGALSLGKAIQELNPNAKAKAESKKASKQANEEISTAESQS